MDSNEFFEFLFKAQEIHLKKIKMDKDLLEKELINKDHVIDKLKKDYNELLDMYEQLLKDYSTQKEDFEYQISILKGEIQIK